MAELLIVEGKARGPAAFTPCSNDDFKFLCRRLIAATGLQ
jgi:hypothetical protein